MEQVRGTQPTQPRDRVRRELESALKAALRKGVKSAFKPSGHSGHLLGYMLSHQEAPTGLEFRPKKVVPKGPKVIYFGL